MEGWSLGLQLDPLSGLQDCLAALEWTARIQNSGVASTLPAAVSHSVDRDYMQSLEANEQQAGDQVVSTSEKLQNGTGDLEAQIRDPAHVRENGSHPAELANGSGKDHPVKTGLPGLQIRDFVFIFTSTVGAALPKVSCL